MKTILNVLPNRGAQQASPSLGSAPHCRRVMMEGRSGKVPAVDPRGDPPVVAAVGVLAAVLFNAVVSYADVPGSISSTARCPGVAPVGEYTATSTPRADPTQAGAVPPRAELSSLGAGPSVSSTGKENQWLHVAPV
jgi:hypothetical protein